MSQQIGKMAETPGVYFDIWIVHEIKKGKIAQNGNSTLEHVSYSDVESS